ncbi:MAG: 4-diphosphocytidyl-2-C-methyl-D-erythritol kinase [Candidatus Omnitrophota bacterium]|jgi:4-diphosphocytidyl-2-C-methyl-D-erythritol kinase
MALPRMPKSKYTLHKKAYAKVNLVLKVLNKRPDGFNNIQTLFERISLYDELSFGLKKEGITLTTNAKGLPTDSKNLVVQAALKLQSVCKVNRGAYIHLKKNLPIASGVGAGSSDAAATLMALNQLWKLKLSTKQLAQLGSEFGSDISFFTLNTPFAIGQGRGEKLKALNSKRRFHHVFLTPRLEVSAGSVYKSLRSQWHTPNVSTTEIAHGLKSVTNSNVRDFVWNILELPILAKYPQIGILKQDFLKAGADFACVSGSGPTLFTICNTPKQAQNIAHKLSQTHPKAYIATATTM